MVPDLVAEAMAVAIEQAAPRRPRRPRTVPPERRSGTCFAGWTDEEASIFVRHLVAWVGIGTAARLCGVSPETVRHRGRR